MLLKSLLLAALQLLLVLSLFAQKSDIAQIEEALMLYLDGGTNNNYYQLAKAFHKGATMKYITDKGYQEVNALQFFSDNMKSGPKQDRSTRIKSIDVSGHAASAHLEIAYPTFSYHDYMHLLKINDEWKIVSKIFYTQEKATTTTAPSDDTYVTTTTEQTTTHSDGIPSLEDIINTTNSGSGGTQTSSGSSTSTNATHNNAATSMGKWAFQINGMNGQIEIVKRQDLYYSMIKYANGQSHEDELYLQNNRIVVKNSLHGEYYMVRRDGNLDVYSNSGFLTTCRLVR